MHKSFCRRKLPDIIFDFLRTYSLIIFRNLHILSIILKFICIILDERSYFMKISNKLETNMQRFESCCVPISTLMWYTVSSASADGMPVSILLTSFTKDDTLLRILQSFGSIKPEAMPDTAHESFQAVPAIRRDRAEMRKTSW